MKESRRREVLERDDYRCVDCGEPVGPRRNPHIATAQIHHQKPRSDGGSDAIENLTTLCDDCHNWRHSNEGGGLVSALVPNRDRRIIRKEDDFSRIERAAAINRVSRRLDRLETDVRLIRQKGGAMESKLDEVLLRCLFPDARRLIRAAEEEWGEEYHLRSRFWNDGSTEIGAYHFGGRDSDGLRIRDKMGVYGNQIGIVREFAEPDDVSRQTTLVSPSSK